MAKTNTETKTGPDDVIIAATNGVIAILIGSKKGYFSFNIFMKAFMVFSWVFLWKERDFFIQILSY